MMDAAILSLYMKASNQLFDCLGNLYLIDPETKLDAQARKVYESGLKSYLYSMILTVRKFQNAEIIVRNENNEEQTRMFLRDTKVGKNMSVFMNVPWIVHTEGNA